MENIDSSGKTQEQMDVVWDSESKEGREKIEAHIENWLLILKEGTLICPNLSCAVKSSSPKVFIDHLKSCTSKEGMQQKILFRGTLPCIICGQEVLIPRYHLHFRSRHKDINENLKMIEEQAVQCQNYRCALMFQDPFLYMKHCMTCRPLYLCHHCKHTYQTSAGFQKHPCVKDFGDKRSGQKENGTLKIAAETVEKRDVSDSMLSNDKWAEQLLSGNFICPNIICSEEFKTPKEFLHHLQKSTCAGKLSVTLLSNHVLPCCICHIDQPINSYLHHLQNSHIEVHWNIETIERGAQAVCPNHKCQKQFSVVKDMIKHCINCRPLYLCQLCHEEFGSQRAIRVHTCCASKRTSSKNQDQIETPTKRIQNVQSEISPKESDCFVTEVAAEELVCKKVKPVKQDLGTVSKEICKTKNKNLAPKAVVGSNFNNKNTMNENLLDNLPSCGTIIGSVSTERTADSDKELIVSGRDKVSSRKLLTLSEGFQSCAPRDGTELKKQLQITVSGNRTRTVQEAHKQDELCKDTSPLHIGNSSASSAKANRSSVSSEQSGTIKLLGAVASSLETLNFKSKERERNLSSHTHTVLTASGNQNDSECDAMQTSTTNKLKEDLRLKSISSPKSSIEELDEKRQLQDKYLKSEFRTDKIFQKQPRKRGRPKKMKIDGSETDGNSEEITEHPEHQIIGFDVLSRSECKGYPTDKAGLPSPSPVTKIYKKRGRLKKVSTSEKGTDESDENISTRRNFRRGMKDMMSKEELKRPKSFDKKMQKAFSEKGVDTRLGMLHLKSKRGRETESRPRSLSDSECCKNMEYHASRKQSFDSLEYLDLFVSALQEENLMKNLTSLNAKTRGEVEIMSHDFGMSMTGRERMKDRLNKSRDGPKVYKKRGRPRKVSINDRETAESEIEMTEKMKSPSNRGLKMQKKRGRPCKVRGKELEKSSVEKRFVEGAHHLILLKQMIVNLNRGYSSDSDCSKEINKKVEPSYKISDYLHLMANESRLKDLCKQNTNINFFDAALFKNGKSSNEYPPTRQATKEDIYLQFFSFENKTKSAKKRGRPRKKSPAEEDKGRTTSRGSMSESAVSDHNDEKPAKKRGRPRKKQLTDEDRERTTSRGSLSESGVSDFDTKKKVPKKRGRPKKVIPHVLPKSSLDVDTLYAGPSMKNGCSYRNYCSDSEIYAKQINDAKRTRRNSLSELSTYQSSNEVAKIEEKRGKSVTSLKLSNFGAHTTMRDGIFKAKKRGRPRKNVTSDNFQENNIVGKAPWEAFRPFEKGGRKRKVDVPDASIDSHSFGTSVLGNSTFGLFVTQENKSLKDSETILRYASYKRRDHSTPKRRPGRPRKTPIGEVSPIPNGEERVDYIDDQELSLKIAVGDVDKVKKKGRKPTRTKVASNSSRNKLLKDTQRSRVLREILEKPKSIRLEHKHLENFEAQPRSLSDTEAVTSHAPIIETSRVRSLSESQRLIKPAGKRERLRKRVIQNPLFPNSSNTNKTAIGGEGEPGLNARKKRGRPSKAELLQRSLEASKTVKDDTQPQQVKTKRSKKLKLSQQTSPKTAHDIPATETAAEQSSVVLTSTPAADTELTLSESPAESTKKRRYRTANKKQKLNNTIEDSSYLSMVIDDKLQDRINVWMMMFNEGIFKCPSRECSEEFLTWMSLFHHMSDCTVEKQLCDLIIRQRTLPCDICKSELEPGTLFSAHFRRYHKDAYDLLREMEANKSVLCYNFKCKENLTTYRECMKHAKECGALLFCEKCNRAYKTRGYFAKHSCLVDVDEIQSKSQVKDLIQQTGQRKSAKRARGAISKLDLNMDEDSNLSTSSKRSKSSDQDFDSSSMVIDDLDEEYEEDDNEDEAIKNEEQLEGENVKDKRRAKFESSKSLKKKMNKTVEGNLSASGSFCNLCKPLMLQTLRRLPMRPRKPENSYLRKWLKKHHSELLFPDWFPSKKTISILSDSEAKDYAPRFELSPVFNVAYEADGFKKLDNTKDMQIRCFEAMPRLNVSNTLTFFAGGPVYAVEWCPSNGRTDQYLAISVNLDYSKVHHVVDAERNKGMIQIWRLPVSTDEKKYGTPCFSYGITIDYGPVYNMKWCPSGSEKGSTDDSARRLGLLAVACSDGLARILSIPYPDDVESLSENKTKEIESKSASPKVAEMTYGNSKANCIEWSPRNGHSRIAVGFADGSISIWRLDTMFGMLSSFSKAENTLVLFPFTRIAAHGFAVKCLSWCPMNENFIASGSYDKSIKVFDIRSPDSPVFIFRRGPFENVFFPIHKAGIMLTEEESFNSVPAGLRFVDLMHNTLSRMPYMTLDLATAHNASCKGLSYSEWLDVVATSCGAGELLIKSCSIVTKSHRLPVYRIENIPLTHNEKTTFNIPNQIEQVTKAMNPTENNNSFRKESCDTKVLDIIRERASSLKNIILMHKFSFKDTNFFEYRDQALDSAKDVDRVRKSGQMHSSNIHQHEIRSINKVQWNPNYGSHHMLASGTFLGFVRIHFFSNWIK